MKLKTIISSILIALCVTVNAQTIHFKWEKDSIGNKLIENIAMSVPFTIENKTYPFQFDLGANHTLIYDKCFENTELLKAKKIDSSSDAAGHKIFSIENQTFNINEYVVKNYKLQGILNFDQGEVCGVVGADIFQNKYLVIDFPNKKMTVSNTLDKKLQSKADFVPIQIKNNKPVLPLKVGDKMYNFQYDSGASIFSMVTYKQNFADLIHQSKFREELNIRNFNNPLVVKAVEISKSIQIGNKKLKTNELWYTDEDYFSLKQDGIDGIIGNVFFMDKIIIIDFVNKRFGIIG
ncbi:hypothetical protein [Chryseobacterium artocarpi]|uniref:hypothetical protein n=1 Tax=Chryseobacterium artocarpi TaxID=1414727 RepID=UPI003F2BB866